MIVAIDAGVRKAGLALGKVAETVRNPYAETTRGPKMLDAALAMGRELHRRIEGAVAGTNEPIEIVLIEIPAARGPRDFAGTDIGNLCAAMGSLRTLMPDVPFQSVPPAAWNGSKPKGYWRDRALAWGSVVNTPPSLSADAEDALGLAMWWELSEGGKLGSLRRILEPVADGPQG